MPIFKNLRTLTVAFLLSSSFLHPITHAVADDATIGHAILTGKAAGYRITHIRDVAAFYDARQNAPLWTKDGELTPVAEEILKDMEESWTHGLNPYNYHVSELRTTAHGTDAELLFTDAVIRYADDLSGMRLPPKLIDEDQSSWSRGVDTSSLLKSLAEDSDPASFLRYLAPQDKTYVALRKELKALAEDIKANPKDNTRTLPYPGILRPAVHAKSIAAIRAKLNVPVAAGEDPTFYDDVLQEAVVTFQKQNGLKPDGLIGRRSFSAINQTREQKLIKVLANLERRRWVRRPLPEKYVAVNIPAMLLRAIDKSEVAFEIPVIVGRPKNQTMSFADNIIGVRFNPSWYVPDSIKLKEYLPQLQKDPNALMRQGIKFKVHGEKGMGEVSPDAIDWSKTTEADLKSIQMLQDPGEKNVLGRIRVLMPNRYDIYLHDTSSPQLFAKDDRALSHGCVRLSEPSRIANFVLAGNPDWTQERLDNYLKKDKTVEVAAAKQVPVYLFYYTAWQDTDGQLIIGDDLYGLDSKLVYFLQEAGKIPFVVHIPPPEPVDKT